MWFFLGCAAIGATFWGMLCGARGKPASFWAALGLALTGLTLCAQYQMIAYWTQSSDWAAIDDVVPTMSKALWILTGISILLNLMMIWMDQKIQTGEK